MLPAGGADGGLATGAAAGARDAVGLGSIAITTAAAVPIEARSAQTETASATRRSDMSP